MCRRVRSPILYQQMRGRGTRTAPSIGKRQFMIYDFFGNHEYFNDSDTDIFTGSGDGSGGSTGGTTKPPGEGLLLEIGRQDEWLDALSYVEVGINGERIDKKEYVSKWEETIKSAEPDNTIIGKIKAQEELSEEEEQQLSQKLNQPENYFNEENLRRAYRDSSGNIIDFIKVALGMETLKSREEILTENFQAWLAARSLSPGQAEYLSLLKNRGIVKGQVKIDDLFQPPLSALNAGEVGVKLFGENGLKEVIKDMNETVFARAV